MRIYSYFRSSSTMFFCVAALCGLIFGLFRPSFFTTSQVGDLAYAMARSLQNQGPIGLSGFLRNMFVFGRAWILLMICSVFPKGAYIALLFAFLRMQALSFATALTVYAHGLFGIIAAIGFIIPNIIILGVYYHTFLCTSTYNNRAIFSAISIGMVGISLASAVALI